MYVSQCVKITEAFRADRSENVDACRVDRTEKGSFRELEKEESEFSIKSGLSYFFLKELFRKTFYVIVAHTYM